jgi:non-heme chloroperoxidase
MLQSENHCDRIDGIVRIDRKRRYLVLGAAAGAAALPLSWLGTALPAGAAGNGSPTPTKGAATMSSNIVKTKDGVEIFYKDWGSGTPIVFSHGWPLSSDDWDAQMMFFLAQGFRVIAHDRRGHGRSSQVATGHDMDHYADDLAAVVQHLDLKGAIHVGHSTGGGEVVRYLARHGEARAAKAVLIAAVPPQMIKSANNPGGLPKDVFDGIQQQVATNRAQFYRDLPSTAFYGFNRPGVKAQEGLIQNWTRSCPTPTPACCRPSSSSTAR